MLKISEMGTSIAQFNEINLKQKSIFARLVCRVERTTSANPIWGVSKKTIAKVFVFCQTFKMFQNSVQIGPNKNFIQMN